MWKSSPPLWESSPGNHNHIISDSNEKGKGVDMKKYIDNPKGEAATGGRDPPTENYTKATYA